MKQACSRKILLPLPELPPVRRMILSLVPTLIILAARPLLPAVLQQTPAALYYPVVLLAVWWGGLVPGVISVIGCTLVSLFFLRPHLLVSPGSDPPGLIRSVMFLATGLLFVLFVSSLQRALKLAESAVRMRDEFLSLASHELKTPLTSLRLQTELAKRALKREQISDQALHRINKLLENLDRQTARLDRLVMDMLDLAFFDSGAETLDEEDFDLVDLAREAVESFGVQAAASGSMLTLIASDPVHGRWDRHRIEQVLGNLLTNAIKYGDGSPIEVQVTRFNGSAKIAVKDGGMGIAPEDQERIFNRFERGVPHSQIQGLGLGLYLSRMIVQLHGGEISLASAPGKGACFTVTLPL